MRLCLELWNVSKDSSVKRLLIVPKQCQTIGALRTHVAGLIPTAEHRQELGSNAFIIELKSKNFIFLRLGFASGRSANFVVVWSTVINILTAFTQVATTAISS